MEKLKRLHEELGDGSVELKIKRTIGLRNPFHVQSRKGASFVRFPSYLAQLVQSHPDPPPQPVQRSYRSSR